MQRPHRQPDPAGELTLETRAGGPPALPADARLLASWQPVPPEEIPTECYAAGADVWILRSDVGGIRFSATPDRILAFLAEGADRGLLGRAIVQDWLPIVYQYWGRQVLHASAVRHVASGAVIACTGPSGAGKSTLGFGLGRRAGWSQLADDTVAFETGSDGVRLLPIPNEVRLRPASARHYGARAYSFERLGWPDARPVLTGLYCLAPRPDQEAAARIRALRRSEAYTRLLEQAFALTLDTGSRNRRLMRDYLAVTRTVPAFELAYRRSFSALDEIVATLERHALATARAVAAAQAQ